MVKFFAPHAAVARYLGTFGLRRLQDLRGWWPRIRELEKGHTRYCLALSHQLAQGGLNAQDGLRV